ncbi:serine O-acetyltransferase EpsC [Methylotenera mobilis]|uniref:serine O-acetyltransferase n=1 Tax=Methylotenera mobilis (strain JLW8 / ATCC BAA-1282 / DSM 17540) TaxID=583345 RepID=C6WUV9_METML|nr:serine O-acetyltransferase EpsC [Methylotenera mobilis]ACT47708.1 Serine O-acetyltransferase [Methylotenera mobilis JLW8]
MSDITTVLPNESFDIPSIVQALRDVRVTSLEHRHRRNKPPKLPARKALQTVIDGLSAALFPNRLGAPGLKDEGIDYFVGFTLDTALRELNTQIQLELRYSADTDHDKTPSAEAAMNKARAFAKSLPKIRKLLDTDLDAAFQGDPAARSLDEVLVCYPGISAIIHYRLAHELHKLGLPLIARIISELAHSATGIDIHPGATIDEGFFIDHGTGVVIGETALIGRHVRLYQAVTLGAKRFPTDEQGHLIKGSARHPILEDDVVIYAGATILGRITIGAGSVIGGNVWLTRSVPPNSQITQAKTQVSATDDVAQ